MVRRRVSAHQLHRAPVFLAFRRIEREPREPQQFIRQRAATLAKRQLAVMITHCRARPATAAMRQQRHVSSRFEVVDFAVRREQTELYEMISAAAGAE